MFHFKSAASAAGRSLSALFAAILARRAIVPLLYADERMLRDIGLTRSDVIDSLSQPFGADPSTVLIARINDRRAVSVEPSVAKTSRSSAAANGRGARVPRQAAA